MIIPLSNLDLSTKAKRTLAANGITNLSELLMLDLDSIFIPRGIGGGISKEIRDFIDNEKNKDLKNGLQENTRELEANNIMEEDDSLQQKLPLETMQLLYKKPISELRLSIRSESGIQRGNITNLGQLLALSESEIKKLPGLGNKSVSEILKRREEWITANLVTIPEINIENQIDIPENKKELFKHLAINFNVFVKLSPKELYNLFCQNGLEDYLWVHRINYVETKDYIHILNNLIELRPYLDRYFESFFWAEKDIISEKEIRERILNDFPIFELANAVCYLFLNYEKLENEGDYYFFGRKSLDSFIQELDETDDMILDRIYGFGLREIGSKYGLTAERVRQITMKRIKSFPPLMEDYYSYPFEFFNFSKDAFYEAFPKASRYSYDFLSIKYKRGRNDFCEASLTEYSNGFLYENIREYYENKIQKQEKKKTKNQILQSIIISHSANYISKEELKKEYNNYIEKNNYDRKKYSFNILSYMNKLRLSKHIVFNRDGEFRYYERDASELWDVIDIKKYNNSIISSEKIYKDYVDILEPQFDIWNGYELFNLLKNTYSEDDASIKKTSITFRRIPMIVIGKGNEEAQLLKILFENSPIKYWDVYEEYEERYGVRKDVAANLGVYIEKYYNNGQYIIDQPRLNEFEKERILGIIQTKQFWLMYELENIFEKICNDSEGRLINSRNMHELGFVLKSGYAYSRDYSSAIEYFKERYLSHDIINYNDIEQEIWRLSTFRSYYLKIRENYEYFEIAPKVIASKEYVFREYNLNEDTLKEIINVTINHCTDKYFNGYSIWDSVAEYDCIKKLKENKGLLTNIIRFQKGIFSFPIGNTVILAKVFEDLNLLKICNWLYLREEIKNLDNLTNAFNQLFGASIDKSKISYKIRGTDLFEKLTVDSTDEYLEKLMDTIDLDGDLDLFEEEFY